MRHSRASLLWIPLAALTLTQAGCPTEKMPPPKEAMVHDEWDNMPTPPEWNHATADFNGAHKAVCDHVLGWVKGEESCTATLCEHGTALAGSWLERCTALSEPPVVETVKNLRGQMSARANNKPTDCGKQLGDILRDGCGDDGACLATGQRWATRCAKAEGTPLVMRMLHRTIERKQEQGAEPVKLDPRTCDELRAEVMELGKCKDRFVCAESVGKVEAYRARCESETDRPSLATAVAEITVLHFGTKKPEPILLRAGQPTLHPGEVPVMLDDKSGGVITVCDERATDLGRYVGSRKGCQSGRMVVARAFTGSSGAEVRVGSLDFPDDATFSARYPTIVGAGELDTRDQEAAAALEAELAKAATTGGAEGAKILARAVIANALAIKRSGAVRGVLLKRDETLVPVMKELAKAKIAATRGKVPGTDLAGLVGRGRTRAFADVAADGTVQIGAATRAFTLDTSALLPRASDAYATAFRGARGRKIDGKTAKAEAARGAQAAQACGAALRKLSETKKALASCNFGLDACDEGKHAALLKTVDEARLAAEAAFHEVEAARSGPAAEEADTVTRAAESAGCREPWW